MGSPFGANVPLGKGSVSTPSMSLYTTVVGKAASSAVSAPTVSSPSDGYPAASAIHCHSVLTGPQSSFWVSRSASPSMAASDRPM